MMDSEKPLDDAEDRYRQGLVYDHYKHLTSLSLLTIGGILLLIPMDTANEIKPFSLWFTLGLVAFGGASAFEVTSEIVRSNYTHSPLRKRFDLMRKIAPISYALGTGGAMMMFVHVLSRI